MSKDFVSNNVNVFRVTLHGFTKENYFVMIYEIEIFSCCDHVLKHLKQVSFSGRCVFF
jgi:hypothetical protein